MDPVKEETNRWCIKKNQINMINLLANDMSVCVHSYLISSLIYTSNNTARDARQGRQDPLPQDTSVASVDRLTQI